MKRHGSPKRRWVCWFLLAYGFWTIGFSGRLEAKTFVLPHVLEKSGTVNNTPFTFDTTMFATYVPGGGGIPGPNNVEIFVFDAGSEQPILTPGGPVANPVDTFTLGPDPLPQTRSLRIDDRIMAAGGYFDNAAKFGFGIIVIGGSDPDNVNVQAYIVNSHTSSLDVAVFGFTPQEINAVNDGGAADETKILRMDGIRETPGNPFQFGGCTDTTIHATYAAGLLDGAPSGSVTLGLTLFGLDDQPLLSAANKPVALNKPFTLSAADRQLGINIDQLITAAGGFTGPLMQGYAVITAAGDTDWLAITGSRNQSLSSPNFQNITQLPALPEPAGALWMLAGAAFILPRRRRDPRPNPATRLRSASMPLETA